MLYLSALTLATFLAFSDAVPLASFQLCRPLFHKQIFVCLFSALISFGARAVLLFLRILLSAHLDKIYLAQHIQLRDGIHNLLQKTSQLLSPTLSAFLNANALLQTHPRISYSLQVHHVPN